MTIKHWFITGRIYNFPQKISLIIERHQITFYDPSRNIAGSFELNENDMIVKAIDGGFVNVAKIQAEKRTMNHYDNGTHKWFSIFEAEKLFGKEAF